MGGFGEEEKRLCWKKPADVGACTHCETDAHGGGERAGEELALVELNQQGGLPHTAVPHQDRLDIQRQRERELASCMQCSAVQAPGPSAAWADSVGYCTCSSVAPRPAPSSAMRCDGWRSAQRLRGQL